MRTPKEETICMYGLSLRAKLPVAEPQNVGPPQKSKDGPPELKKKSSENRLPPGPPRISPS